MLNFFTSILFLSRAEMMEEAVSLNGGNPGSAAALDKGVRHTVETGHKTNQRVCAGRGSRGKVSTQSDHLFENRPPGLHVWTLSVRITTDERMSAANEQQL